MLCALKQHRIEMDGQTIDSERREELADLDRSLRHDVSSCMLNNSNSYSKAVLALMKGAKIY